MSEGAYGSKYSRMDEVKFVEERGEKRGVLGKGFENCCSL